MEISNTPGKDNWKEEHYRSHRRGRIFGGLILIATGSILIAKKLGVFIPDWVFTWEMIVIAVGLWAGARCGFRGFGWLIPIIIAGIFLIDNFNPQTPLKPFIIPAIIIGAGLLLILRPRRKDHWGKWEHRYHERSWGEHTSSEDYIESTAIFGGFKKTIISKDFKGGEVTCVFGGAEINLNQADISGRVILEATQVFGGTKLIIPPHWQVHSEMTAVLGGIEDKRPASHNTDHTKILVIKGTTIFGGIEIKSY